MSRFDVQVFKGFIGNILTAIIGFCGSILFARIVGPSGYGAFYTIAAVVNLVDNPVQGFATAGKKRLSEANPKESEIVGASFLVAVLALIMVFPLILFFGIPFIDIKNEGKYFIILFTGTVLFKILQPLVAGSGKFSAPPLLDSGRSFFTIASQIVLVLLGWGVGGMIVGLALGSAMMVPFSLRLLSIEPVWPSRETVWSMWEYARWSMPKSVVGSAISRIDLLLLSSILTTSATGQYRIALNILVPATFVSGVIGTGVLIETSESVSLDESPRERIEIGVGFASIFSIPIFFGALAMPVDIVTTIYGDQYQTAGTLLTGLAAYKFFETQNDQLVSILGGFDRPDLRFYISVGVLFINAALGIMLLHQIGIFGIVIATLIAGAFRWIAALYFTQRLIKFNPLPNPLRKQFIAGILMFIIIWLLHLFVAVKWWGDLIVLVGAGAAVYSTTLLTISPRLRVASRSLITQIFTT